MLKTGSRNIPVSKINLDFIKAFYQFIRKEKNNGHNTATSLIGCFRSILLPAIKNRVIRENPFDKFDMKRDEVIREILEMNEIKLLEDLEGLSPLMDIKRDAFLIACYTGLAYNDLKELR